MAGLLSSTLNLSKNVASTSSISMLTILQINQPVDWIFGDGKFTVFPAADRTVSAIAYIPEYMWKLTQVREPAPNVKLYLRSSEFSSHLSGRNMNGSPQYFSVC